MANKPVKLEKKLFETFDEAAISYSKVKKADHNLLAALVESFNNKFNSRFYMDAKRKEIVHAGIIKEASYSQFAKLISLLEKKSLSVNLCESQASKKSAFTRLMESELQQAEIILAAQSISDRLQKMAEDLAQMVSEDVLPISDQMKSVFGTDYAEKWAQITKEALESAFETVSGTKDSVSDATRILEKKLEGETSSANDMGNLDVGGDDLGGDDLDLGDEGDDLLGGADAASGPDDEPLGRAKKESREYLKKKLNESETLFVGNRDFDEVETYKGYTLGSTEHDDGDVRKIDYDVYKLEKEEKAEGLPRPQRKYKRIKGLGLSPYVKEHEAIKLFRSTVDKMGVTEAPMFGGNRTSETPKPFGRRKPTLDVGTDGGLSIGSSNSHKFSYEHVNGSVFIYKDGGELAKDRFRLSYGDAMEFMKDIKSSPESKHQDIMKRYFNMSYYSKPKMTPEGYADGYMDHMRGRLKTDTEVRNKAQADTPYSYDVEGSSIVIRKGHSSMAHNSTRTLSAQDTIDFIKDIRSADSSEHQRIMAEYYNLAHGVYEHENPEPYLEKIRNKGYEVNYTREKNGAIYFAISKKNDFDEYTSDNETLHVIEPREGEYMIDMNYKAKFKSLEDAVDYHFGDDKIKENSAGAAGAVVMPLGGEKKVKEETEKKPDLKAIAKLLGKSIVGKKLSAPQLAGEINKAANASEDGVKEGGMPASVIKSKTRYAEMTDEELAKTLSNKSEEELRQMAWRHGYGKMSDHYVKRVAKGAKTEASPFTYAAKKAKEQGKKEFELDGKTFKVDEDETTDAEKVIDTLKNKGQAPKRIDPRKQQEVNNLAQAMKRDPKLKDTLSGLIGEALSTIREDIMLGIPQHKAIQNSAIIFNLNSDDLTEAWMAANK